MTTKKNVQDAPDAREADGHIKNPERYWPHVAKEALVGRTIKDVRWLTRKEADTMGWGSRPVVVVLDDGSLMFPQRDDEGNDGGALYVQKAKGEDVLLPVL